jgi:hypothetical protein
MQNHETYSKEATLYRVQYMPLIDKSTNPDAPFSPAGRDTPNHSIADLEIRNGMA